MAPKRRAKVVVSSTRKIVRETVQVAVIQKPEGDDNGDQRQSEMVPFEDIITEISLEGLRNIDKAQKEPQRVEIPVEAPETKEVQKQQKTEQVNIPAKEPPTPLKKEKEKKKKKRKYMDGNEAYNYKTYVFKVLKQVHPGMAISSQAMSVINSLMRDMFEKIADEATKLSKYTQRKTLSSREIQGAVRLVLPGELGKHAVAEGRKAVTNYASYDLKN